MFWRIGLAILLGSVAASAVVFYFWSDELDIDIERKKLERNFRSKYANSSTDDN